MATNITSVAPKPAEKWGTLATMFFGGHRDQAVTIHLQNGETLGGDLIGVDKYDLCVRRADGTAILVAKHAIAWIEPALKA
jgi:sRNA-binding regulator protein Hfq